MKNIKIGILGAALNNGNLGVNALGFCLVNVVSESAKKYNKNAKIVFFSTDNKEDIYSYVNDMGIYKFDICTPISIKKFKVLKEFKNKISECDLVIDVTGGDSFSDIYGNNRCIRETIGKFIAEKYSTIVLAPQTIGPFKTKFNKWLARRAMDKAGIVFARDKMSYDYAKSIVKKAEIKLTSDLAFDLPYDNQKIVSSDKIKIGLNINALMWNGGYNCNNQFELKTDYINYVYSVVEGLNKKENVEIHLISHVVHKLEVENDYLICREIKDKYPDCILVEPFSTPMQAKTYIKDMDVFIGGRMHSTIAASSTNVAVIPVSYSRKFEGLYNTLGYDHLINCRDLDTETAISKTFELIDNRKTMSEKIANSSNLAKERLSVFYDYLDEMISKI